MSRASVRDRLLRPLFGPDLFLSYSRRDTRYVQKLVTLLRRRNEKLSICIDQWAARPYPTTHPDLLALARRSSVFVLIASDPAVKSRNVAAELRTFRATGRKIVPIDVNGALARAQWPPDASDAVPLPEMLATLGPEQETTTALNDGEPSENVVSRILGSIDFHIQTQRIRFFAAATLLLMLFAVALLAGLDVLRRRQARIAVGLRLANDSVSVLQQEPHRVERAVRLATESLHRLERERAPTLAADMALRDALALLPRVERRVELGDRRKPTLSRDGRFAAAVSDAGILLCETARGSCATLPIPATRLQNLAFSADGAALAATLAPGGVHVWSTATRAAIGRPIAVHAEPYAVAVGRGGRLVAFGAGDRVFVYDTDRGAMLAESAHAPQPLTIEWSPDERHLLTTSDTAQVWEWRTRNAPIVLQREGVMLGRFAPDGERIALLDSEGLSVWKWRGDRARPEWASDLPSPLSDVQFSPDGRRLAVSHMQDGVRVYDMERMKLVTSFPGSAGRVAFTRDGASFVVAGGNRTVHLWHIGDERELARATHDTSFPDVAVRADGAIVSASDELLQVWRAADWLGHEVRLPENAQIRGIAFDPKSGALAIAAPSVFRYDLTRRALVRTRVFGGGPIAFTSAGELVTNESRRFTPWRDWASGAPRRQPPLAIPGDATTLAIGAETIVAGSARELVLYDANGTAGRRFATKQARAAAIDATGRYLATADLARLQLVDLRNGETLDAPPAGAAPRGAAFDPGGRALATTSGPAIRLWERWRDGEAREMARIRLHRWNARHVAFDADGTWLAAASERIRPRVFVTKWRPADLLDAACTAVPGGWTEEEWRSDLPGDDFAPVCATTSLRPAAPARVRP